jgi:hypothetical protein
VGDRHRQPGAVATYKDLYRVSENTRLHDGLDFQTDAHYDVPDTEARFAAFVAKLSRKV